MGTGGMEDYNYIHSSCFEITLELSCCKYPKADQLAQEWENNRDALLAYLEMVSIFCFVGFSLYMGTINKCCLCNCLCLSLSLTINMYIYICMHTHMHRLNNA